MGPCWLLWESLEFYEVRTFFNFMVSYGGFGGLMGFHGTLWVFKGFSPTLGTRIGLKPTFMSSYETLCDMIGLSGVKRVLWGFY